MVFREVVLCKRGGTNARLIFQRCCPKTKDYENDKNFLLELVVKEKLASGWKGFVAVEGGRAVGRVEL